MNLDRPAFPAWRLSAVGALFRSVASAAGGFLAAYLQAVLGPAGGPGRPPGRPVRRRRVEREVDLGLELRHDGLKGLGVDVVGLGLVAAVLGVARESRRSALSLAFAPLASSANLSKCWRSRIEASSLAIRAAWASGAEPGPGGHRARSIVRLDAEPNLLRSLVIFSKFIGQALDLPLKNVEAGSFHWTRERSPSEFLFDMIKTLSARFSLRLPLDGSAIGSLCGGSPAFP